MENKEIKSLHETIFWAFFATYIFSLLWFAIIINNLNNATEKIEALQESVDKQRQEVASLRIYITELEDENGE